jgi:hypothetical protein
MILLRVTCLLLTGVVAALQGCAYPRVVKYYDEECQIMAKKMVVDVAKVSVLDSCEDDACLTSLVVGIVASASTHIVAGSVVHVGNTIYWREARRTASAGNPTYLRRFSPQFDLPAAQLDSLAIGSKLMRAVRPNPSLNPQLAAVGVASPAGASRTLVANRAYGACVRSRG